MKRSKVANNLDIMKTYTILIADDNHENIQLIVDVLESSGIQHKIIRAVNGKVLCELALKRCPDLIITDWEMPEMNGIEAITILKNNESTKDIPIIMCTGRMTSSENLKMALDSGAVDYIKKPIDSIELHARVYSMLKLTDSYRTIKEQNIALEQQKEMLLAVNKELSETNKELYSQREELDATLQSLKIAQKQLVQSEKMASIGILAAGIAHEINNPLNFINGGITGIDHYFNENLAEYKPNVEFYINGVNEGVKRAVEIVSGLNHYSRSGEFITEEINIHTLIDNCLLILQNKTKNRIEIIKNYTNSTYRLIGNEGHLHQAMLNILLNSVQSIDDQGTITINTKIENKYIKITVSDSGCGIDEENLSKIFDPFFTTKETGEGTGLGLSITYNILQEHNGSILCESVRGKGTTTIITLPIENALY